MQTPGNQDTMTDLMVNCLGALLASAIGYRCVKGDDSLIADRLIHRFVQRNRHLFRDTPEPVDKP